MSVESVEQLQKTKHDLQVQLTQSKNKINQLQDKLDHLDNKVNNITENIDKNRKEKNDKGWLTEVVSSLNKY